MNFKVSQLKSLTAGEVAVDDLIYVIDSNPTDGSVKSKKVTVGDLIDSRIYGISSSQFVLITGYYADPSWITSLDWSKITNAPSFVTSLSALTDVQLSTPLSGQALVYNGTKWVNQGIGELDTLATVTTRGNTTTNPITVGALTVATNLISTDIGNSRVGIGTTSPAYKLEVIGTPRFSGGSAQGAIFGAGTVINLGSDAYMLATSTAGKNAGYTISRFSTGEYASFDLLTAASLGSGWSIQMRPTSTRLDIVDRSPSDNIRMTFFNGGNIAIGTTTDSGYKLRVNGTVSAQLTNATHASQVYYNTSTGELTYGAAPVPTTPTLDQVTTAGNTTTNAITVGLINSTALRAVVTITDTTAGVNNPSYFGSYDNFLQLSVNRNPSTGVYAQTGKASSQISLEGDAGTSSIRFYTTTTNNSIPSERMRIFGGGNITIGNNVDAGYKLDVNGNARVTGVASLSSIASQTTIVDGAVFNADTTSFNITGGRGNNQEGILNLTSTVGSFTPNFGGVKNMLNIGGNFTVGTSAAGDVNFLNINPTINYPVGSSGTQRGIYINPTLTRVTNYKAIEVAQGVIVTTSPITAASALAQGVYFNNTLVQAAASDVLTAFQITPTFTVDPTLLHNAYWMRFTGAYSPAAYNNPNNNATTLDLANSFTNTANAIGLRIRHTYSNVQNGYGILLESAGFIGIAQTSTTSTNYLAGTTVVGSSIAFVANTATLNVINGTNGGIKVGSIANNNQHLIISHSEAGNTFSSIRSTFNSTSAVMLIDVAAQGNLRLFGTGNVTVGTTTDAGFKLDVNGSSRITGNLTITAGGSGTNTFNANVNYLFANQNNVYGLVDLQNAAGQNVFLKVTGTPTAGTGFDYFWISGTTTSSTIGTTRNIFNVSPTYNLTGAFTGTMRGFYYNPTLTSMTGAVHRAIETTSGDVIFNGGNVGIGTTTPTSKLFIYTDNTSSTIGDNNAFIIHNNNPNWATSGAGNLTELFFSDAGQGSGTTNGLNLNHRYAGISAFLTGWNGLSSAGGLNFITKETTGSTLGIKLQIKPNGNVLIGTTTDSGYKLDVNGSVRIISSLLVDTFGTNNAATLGGVLQLNSSITVLNKAQTTWIPFATRNQTGSEVVYDLSNIGSISAKGLSPGLFSQTSDSVAVTNTTVESSLISTGVGTLSVPANGFQVGAAYIAYLSGVMSSQNNATMEIHLRSNGFILADTDPMILSATTGKFWELHVNFVIRAIGGGGVAAIVTSGRFSYNKDSGNIPESLGFSGVNNTTFDTTINNTLTVTATWGNASPSNSIQTRIFNLYRVY